MYSFKKILHIEKNEYKVGKLYQFELIFITKKGCLAFARQPLIINLIIIVF